jgi:hypothetical protein
MGNARFHSRIEIAGADLEDPVHPRDIDTHPAPQRQDIAFHAGTSAKRDQRHLVARADGDDFAHLLSRLGKGDGVRRYVRMIGRILTMLLAYLRGARQSNAQHLTQRYDCGIARGRVNGFSGNGQSHNDSFVAGSVLS